MMLSTFAVAFGMSADAFAASLGKGAALERPRLGEIVRTGVIFGSIETIAPILGWVCGLAAGPFIAAIDHWVAFGLLGLVGAKMVWESRRRPADAPRTRRHSSRTLILTAIGTSIDALAVGSSLALIGEDILETALVVGLVSCLMSALGVAIGRLVGAGIGRAAEAAGGVILIAVGSAILGQHLGILA